ncbi:MAG: PEGA domain-containing protein [Polyangiaceae bacterium]|nr:PEGA domain-containing protein [Polyangiaceae bacterium]
MKVFGDPRGVASAIAVAIGLAVAPAWAQIAPTAGPIETPPPPKPTGSAAPPAPPSPEAPPVPKPGKSPAPAAAKPAPAATKAPAKGAKAKPANPKALFASGEKKFKAGDYEGALADFEASIAAKPSPEAERYIALCHDNLQHYQEAVTAFEKFIANPAANKEKVEEAKSRILAIKAIPGKVHVESTPTGATIAVDAKPNANEPAGGGGASGSSQSPGTQPTPTPTELDLAPGTHTIHVMAEGFEPADKEIEVDYASKQNVHIELVKKEAPPPPPPPPPVGAEVPAAPPTPPPAPPLEPRSKVPAYVTGGVAIAALGVGIGFGIKALSQSNDFSKNPTSKLADDGQNNALVADLMFGVAITFGVTSAVLFFSHDEPSSAKTSAGSAVASAASAKKKTIVITPTPYVSPSGGGAGLHVQF